MIGHFDTKTDLTQDEYDQMPLTIARRRTGAGGNLDHKANTTLPLDHLTQPQASLRIPGQGCNSTLLAPLEQSPHGITTTREFVSGVSSYASRFEGPTC